MKIDKTTQSSIYMEEKMPDSQSYQTQKNILNKIKSFFLNIIHEPMIIISILLLLFILLFLRPFLVPSGSMIPTLVEGDRIISIQRYFPNGQTYSEGDIACFKAPTGQVFVKRIIANGGDTVEISEDQVYVNGEVSPWQGAGTGAVSGVWKLADDEYFMMGDNRSNSADSRYIGPVKASDMISKVYLIYFPLDHIKWL